MGNSLRGNRVCLERLQEHHIDQYIQMFSPRVRALLRVKAALSERNYLLKKAHDTHTLFYVVKDAFSQIIIGAIEIRNPAYRSQLYCWIHELWWAAGAFQEAIALASAEYFNGSSNETLSARVDCTNLRSYHALKKAGFESCGIVDGPECKQYQLVLKRDVEKMVVND